MKVCLSNSPVSWGVDYADDPKNPPWVTVLDGIAAAGYLWTELGPYGYLPTDSTSLRAELGKRGLSLTAGVLFQPLNDPSKTSAIITLAEQNIDLLSMVGGRYLVMIDMLCEPRMSTAGRRDLAERLEPSRFYHMLDLFDRIADLALAKGLVPVIHPHAGTYIEFEDEIEDVLVKLDAKKIGLCIDTGHMVYAGVDLLSFYHRHANRVKYLHLKDINPAVHADALRDRKSFYAAVADRIFCPLGQGVVKWREFAAALDEKDYDGAATVEQDVNPEETSESIQDSENSLMFLQSMGF